jgi:hypothetical protein
MNKILIALGGVVLASVAACSSQPATTTYNVSQPPTSPAGLSLTTSPAPSQSPRSGPDVTVTCNTTQDENVNMIPVLIVTNQGSAPLTFRHPVFDITWLDINGNVIKTLDNDTQLQEITGPQPLPPDQSDNFYPVEDANGNAPSQEAPADTNGCNATLVSGAS